MVLEINETEGRKVLHTAIRSFENSTPNYDQVLEDRKKLKDFTEQVLGGKLKVLLEKLLLMCKYWYRRI